MLPDRVSSPGPLTYESGALPIALRGPASKTYVFEDLSVKGRKTRIHSKREMVRLSRVK